MKSIFQFTLSLLCIIALGGCYADESLSDSGSSNTVLSGSYANMLTIGDKLYMLAGSTLQVLDISKRDEPQRITSIEVNDGIESLFYNSEHLFVGSDEGMFIYSLDASGIPILQSQTSYDNFDIVLPCDPIVANDTIAFSTLSTTFESGPCQRIVQLNQLRIYDIKNVTNPDLITTLEMETPKGLGLDGEHLFVCEQYNGIKAFDVSSPNNIREIYHSTEFEARDVIPANGILMVVSSDTLYQYDYSNIDNIYRLSSYGFED